MDKSPDFEGSLFKDFYLLKYMSNDEILYITLVPNVLEESHVMMMKSRDKSRDIKMTNFKALHLLEYMSDRVVSLHVTGKQRVKSNVDLM